jgi:hypothetical protein
MLDSVGVDRVEISLSTAVASVRIYILQPISVDACSCRVQVFLIPEFSNVRLALVNLCTIRYFAFSNARTA